MTEQQAIKNFNLENETLSQYTETSFQRIVCTEKIERNNMAIKALEKQSAKKVKIEQWTDTKCECGYCFSKDYDDGYYSIPVENKTNYCPKCGQKLDWGNDD